VRDKIGNLLADSHNDLKRRNNCFSQLPNVYSISGGVGTVQILHYRLQAADRTAWV
jgi:hypothetical protein